MACERLQELEAQCSITDLTPHSVMAVVAAAEPHFLQQLAYNHAAKCSH